MIFLIINSIIVLFYLNETTSATAIPSTTTPGDLKE